jgi:hypothetical protein
VPDVYPHGVPIPGPIHTDPSGPLGPDSIASARQMLATAVAEMQAAGVELGDYDRRILTWCAGWDQPTVAVLASLLRRALHAEVPDA